MLPAPLVSISGRTIFISEIEMQHVQTGVEGFIAIVQCRWNRKICTDISIGFTGIFYRYNLVNVVFRHRLTEFILLTLRRTYDRHQNLTLFKVFQCSSIFIHLFFDQIDFHTACSECVCFFIRIGEVSQRTANDCGSCQCHDKAQR